MVERRLTKTAATSGLLLALLVAPLGAVAHAAPTWGTGTDISDVTRTTTAPSVATNGKGDSVAAWMAFLGDRYAIESATRPAGGTWSSPVEISAEGRFADVPEVVVAPDGSATAVWRANDDNVSPLQIEYADMSAGGTWSSAQVMPNSDTAGDPQLAVDDEGNTLITWTHVDGVEAPLLARYRPAGGSWSEEMTVADTGDFTGGTDAAFDPAGRVTLAWLDAEGPLVVRASTWTPGGVWSEPGVVSQDSEAPYFPQLAVAPSGEATVTWYDSRADTTVIEVSTRPPGGAWSHPATISDETTNYDPVVGVDAQGVATVVWVNEGDEHNSIWAARRPVGGDWGSPALLSRPDEDTGYGPALAVGAAGGATALWSADDTVRSAHASPGGAWGEPRTVAVAEDARAITAGADDAGDVTTTWGHRGDGPGTVDVVAAAGLDVGGPVLTGFTTASGQAHQPLPFSAAATDVWSTVATYAWSFGDGTTGTGPALSHAYANAGTYGVALTVTDSVGNATTRTASVTVTPVPLAKPVITTFTLTKKKIATNQRTRLKVALSTPATLKVVLRSKHRHDVRGQEKRLRKVIVRRLPAGTSRIVIKGKRLRPDAWKVVGVAKNAAGSSGKKKVRLVVAPPSLKP